MAVEVGAGDVSTVVPSVSDELGSDVSVSGALVGAANVVLALVAV